MKEKYDLNTQKRIFERNGFKVPANESELREFFNQKKFPKLFIKEALIKAGFDVEEDIVEADERLEKFLEFYEIKYNESEAQKNSSASTEKKTVKKSMQSSSDKSEMVLSLEKAQKFWNECTVKRTDDKVSTGRKRMITEGLDITLRDKISVKPEFSEFFENAVIIFDDEQQKVVAVGKLESDNAGERYFTASYKNVIFDCFAEKNGFKIALFSKKPNFEAAEYYDGEIYCGEIYLEKLELKKSERCLCIDFGTSNTSAGTYGIINPESDVPEIVNFVDSTNNNALSLICPTIVYVQNCRDSDNVKYLFGYEAKKKIIESHYLTNADVFYEIKQWVGNNEIITIHDENTNMAKVTKKEIVKKYIDYIIQNAKNYFHCDFTKLHFTAPIKMKSKFIIEMENLYQNEYNVCPEEESIDEAIAIIYDYIFGKAEELINENRNEEEKKMVVFDCGGGTTDLAVCSYLFKTYNDEMVEIKTQFENGKSNFGGNNITFRILQLIKIKLAKFHQKISEAEYNEFFRYSENDILRAIDSRDYTFNDIFEKLYQKCEEFIPTRYNDENSLYFRNQDIKNMKRNFYYLWQYAEGVKLAFYMKEKVLVNVGDSETLNLSDIEDNEYIYVYDNGTAEQLENPLKKIEINITEIRKIICGDIYRLLNEVLPENPDSYDYYRLSGQSCKINLFNELLKEFIPGKKLREKINSKNKDETNIGLKLKCISGSINYICQKEYGYFNFNHLNATAKVNYSVYFKGFANQNMEAFKVEQSKISLYKINEGQKICRLFVKNASGEIVKEISHPTEVEEGQWRSMNYNVLRNKLNKESLIDTSKLIEKLTDPDCAGGFVVALPAKDGYGFIVHILYKKSDNGTTKYFCNDKGTFYGFEESYESFFDGKR